MGKNGVSLGLRYNVQKVFVVQASSVHQASNMAFVFVQFFVLVVHGGARLSQHDELSTSIEKIAQPVDAFATEDAEDLTLLLSKFGWGFSTKGSEIVSQERVNTSKAEMGESRAVIQQCVNSLVIGVRSHKKAVAHNADVPPWSNEHSN